MDNDMKIRESVENDYGTLSVPMTYKEFLFVLDSLDSEYEEDRDQ